MIYFLNVLKNNPFVMLTKEEKAKLDKKLNEFQKSQYKAKEDFVKRRHLDKEGDENWRKYVVKQLAWWAKYEKKEFRGYRAMLVRELYNRRKKGYQPSPMINL